MVNYNLPEHKQFVEDMEEAGLEVEIYHGRYWWHGPSVNVDNLQDALSCTKVKCQWDNMGKGWVVYPVIGDDTLKDAHEIYEDDEE